MHIIILPYRTGIRIFKRCTDRADLHTCRILAMLTRNGYILLAEIRKRSTRCIHGGATICQNAVPDHIVW